MKYQFLGKSGLKVSALSFGSWVTFGNQADVDLAADMMKAAYDHGVNFFDNAEVYAGGASETIMGKAIKKLGFKRSDLVLSTKIFWGGKGPNDRGLSRKHIIEGLDHSLERMDLDYVDLVFAHRPDVHTPIEETVRAFNHVIDQGKALYWGTSEWNARQITEAYEIAEKLRLIPPTMEQSEYNMFHRNRFESDYLPVFEKYGMGTTTWSPLASGLLTGKYNQGIPEDSRVTLEGYEWLKERFEKPETEEKIQKIEKMMKIADDIGCSMAQMALAWCLTNPNVSTVITGASKVKQVDENMKALDYVDSLTPDVLEKLEEILDNKPNPPTDFR